MMKVWLLTDNLNECVLAAYSSEERCRAVLRRISDIAKGKGLPTYHYHCEEFVLDKDPDGLPAEVPV